LGEPEGSIVTTRLLDRPQVGRLDLIWVGGFVTAALAGWLIVRGQVLLALVPVGILAGLVLVSSLSLAGWLVLMLLATVAARGVVQTLHLPSVLVFLHYPAALAFAYTASNRPRAEGVRLPASRWMIGFLLIVGVSSAINLTSVGRTVLLLVILGEPLLVIWAVQRWGVDAHTERQYIRAFMWLLAIQIPIGLWQGSTKGWFDAVQGTLIGQGAGAHVLGALFALGMFVWLAGILDGRLSTATAPLALVVAFGMMAAGGALQVILVGAAALPFVLLGSSRKRMLGEGRTLEGHRRAAKLFLAAFVLSAVLLTPAFAQEIVPNVLERATALFALRNFPEVTLPLERAGVDVEGQSLDPGSNPIRALVGSGPATSSTRAALLLVPSYEKAGALSELNVPLKPTRLAEKIAAGTSGPNGGSAEATASEILGIEGDLGVLGLVGLIGLFFGIYRASRTSRSWLAPAMAAALVMTFALSFIDNWLEYPEFAVPLALLIGLATYPVHPLSEEPAPRRTIGSEQGARTHRP
jgi:hypothetical protein